MDQPALLNMETYEKILNLPQWAGMCPFISPKLWAFFTISQGNFPVLSYSAATGMISSCANLRASSRNSFWVSDSSGIKKKLA